MDGRIGAARGGCVAVWLHCEERNPSKPTAGERWYATPATTHAIGASIRRGFRWVSQALTVVVGAPAVKSSKQRGL
jgi:hypothetical protein